MEIVKYNYNISENKLHFYFCRDCPLVLACLLARKVATVSQIWNVSPYLEFTDNQEISNQDVG